MTSSVNILILGGGYAGLMAALRLSGRTKKLSTKITLINGSEQFVERPRLPEVAVGKKIEQQSIQEMLRQTSVNFIQGWIKKIEPYQREVILQNGAIFSFDYLVIALGSHVSKKAIPGIKQFAFTPDPHGERSARSLHQFLASLKRQRRIVIIGGGATGIEMATEVKGAYPHQDVILLTNGEVGHFKGARIKHQIQAALQAQQIIFYEQCQITAISSEGVIFNNELFQADCVIWAGGFQCSTLAKEAGLRVNHQNQILVDPYLRSLSNNRIYAVGDAAFPVGDCGVPVRMALLPALITGATAAENIYRRLIEQEERPLSFEWYGQAITLGPNDAVGFNTYPKDQPVGPILRGRLALNTRNFFVSFLGKMLEYERRWTGSFYWTGRRRHLKANKQVKVAHDRQV
ncbi:MAG: FAD-dependent oxidoreductase [Chloroflexota bacterium]